jgi:hypothetical protein
VKPDVLASVAIPILLSEVFMVLILGVEPYVKLTAAFQRTDL